MTRNPKTRRIDSFNFLLTLAKNRRINQIKKYKINNNKGLKFYIKFLISADGGGGVGFGGGTELRYTNVVVP